MSFYSVILFWFRANRSLVFLLNAACLVKKQQIPIVSSLFWPDRGFKPQSTALEASTLTINGCNDILTENDNMTIRPYDHDHDLSGIRTHNVSGGRHWLNSLSYIQLPCTITTTTVSIWTNKLQWLGILFGYILYSFFWYCCHMLPVELWKHNC